MFECKFCMNQFSQKEIINERVCQTCLEKERPTSNIVLALFASILVGILFAAIAYLIAYLICKDSFDAFKFKHDDQAATSPHEAHDSIIVAFAMVSSLTTIFLLAFGITYSVFTSLVKEKQREWDVKNLY